MQRVKKNLRTFQRNDNAMSLVNARLVLLKVAWLFHLIIFSSSQGYSVNFQQRSDAESCHMFCGKNEDCEWWSFEPSQSMCMAFKNCTESGNPDNGACPDCISGERLYVNKFQLQLKTHSHVFYPPTVALQGNVMTRPNVMAISRVILKLHI